MWWGAGTTLHGVYRYAFIFIKHLREGEGGGGEGRRRRRRSQECSPELWTGWAFFPSPLFSLHLSSPLLSLLSPLSPLTFSSLPLLYKNGLNISSHIFFASFSSQLNNNKNLVMTGSAFVTISIWCVIPISCSLRSSPLPDSDALLR